MAQLEARMSVLEELSVPYHQQDEWDYCGAACSEMVLEALGGGILGQDILFGAIQSHNLKETTGWYSAPDGIAWVLDNSPTTTPGTFAANICVDAASISRQIAWSIYDAELPAVALVYGQQHWVVVRGFQASALPKASDDASYSISSFDVNNPCPAVPDPAKAGFPPPHGATDGCGSGGNHGAGDENIAYTQWADTYMTGVRRGAWKGFVAVCSPAYDPCSSVAMRPMAHRASGDRILTHEEVVTYSLAGLKDFGLRDRKAWKRSLSGTTPGKPMLVQRLDRTDEFYYIVPMESGPNIAHVLVCINARFGDYLQAVRVSVPGGSAFAGLNFDSLAALASVLDRRFSAGKRRGKFVVRPEASALYPTLVWRPCRESRSPYYPFFMITVGNHKIYVRVDGQVFTRLHVNDWGI
jgi:hypothetical protein